MNPLPRLESKKTVEKHEGKQEKQEKLITRPDVSVAQAILLVLAQKGPMSFREIIQHPSVQQFTSERTENSFYTALARMKRRRSIVRTPDRRYELTPAGEYASLKALVRKELVVMEKKSPTPKAWDGRWRIVFFDIPERHRPMRDYIRSVLKRIGCREFQRSMWIYPHKLPAFFIRLCEEPRLRSYIKIVTTYDVDYDEDLRRQFKLA